MGKRIPMWQCLTTILFTIIVLMYTLGIFGKIFGEDTAWNCTYGQAHIALIAACIFASLIAIANGFTWSFLEAGILASISRSLQAILILLCVGALIGAWIASGVIPAMICYGTMILKPTFFLTASCLICCIVSLATGSSWTTAGTIGVALVSIGAGLGISAAMTAGAIVSGAYFGDKMSPLSDTTNLAPAMAGADIFDHIKHMIWTVTPSLVIALLVYTFLGLHTSGNMDMTAVNDMQDALRANFHISPVMLIPPLAVILIVAMKLPALPGLICGILLSCIIGSLFQDIPLSSWPSLLHYGYMLDSVSDAFAQAAASVGESDPLALFQWDSADFSAAVEAEGFSSAVVGEYNAGILLNGRGGMNVMMWTITLVICATCYGGVMNASGMLSTITEALLKLAKNTGMLVTVTILSCISLNIISGDQYLSIVLPGRMFKEAFEDRKLAPKNLSRCLEDSATVTSNLVPWNTCGATMHTFLGTPQWGLGGYAPFAILCWVNPLVSIFYGFTGISMTKLSDEEYGEILRCRKKQEEERLKELEA